MVGKKKNYQFSKLLAGPNKAMKEEQIIKNVMKIIGFQKLMKLCKLQ